MDPVSNVDRLVLLLRARLLERARTAGRGEARRPAAQKPPTSLANLQALAAIDTVDDRQLGRAFIQSILVDELGSELINEAKFQQVVDRVAETLRAEPATSQLLSRLLSELRSAAR